MAWSQIPDPENIRTYSIGHRRAQLLETSTWLIDLLLLLACYVYSKSAAIFKETQKRQILRLTCIGTISVNLVS